MSTLTSTREFGLGVRVRMPRAGTVVTFAAFVAVLLVGGLTTPNFLSVDNIKAILLASAFVGIVAIGMTMIMLSGHLFSLSLGITAAVCAMVFLYALRFGLVPAILAAIIVGCVVCALQGGIVGGLGADPIIVTIGAGVVLEGLSLWLTKGVTVYPPSGEAVYEFLKTPLLGIPFPFYVLVAVTVVAELTLRRTRFGRHVYLVGTSKAAADAAALPVTWIVTGAFAAAGACAGVAGVLLGAFNENATLSIQGTFTFDAIAAALVGGTAIGGGQGSAVRTFFGAIVIATIASLLLLRDYSTGVQLLARGLIVVAAVLMLHLGSGRRS
jgi:ribose/xylose/arabinose/galactoside ABC-type transport system permease subunit